LTSSSRLALDRVRIARQQHARLNLHQHCRHVNKLGGNVHIELANLLHIAQILRRDARNGNVVNINILLADQVQQQVQRPVENLIDGDRKGRLAFFRLLRVRFFRDDQRRPGDRRRCVRG